MHFNKNYKWTQIDTTIICWRLFVFMYNILIIYDIQTVLRNSSCTSTNNTVCNWQPVISMLVHPSLPSSQVELVFCLWSCTHYNKFFLTAIVMHQTTVNVSCNSLNTNMCYIQNKFEMYNWLHKSFVESFFGLAPNKSQKATYLKCYSVQQKLFSKLKK